MYLIKETARLSGVSVRTLRHYDRIGLLCPQKAENGYRYYSEEDMETLQQILFYKYLDFALKYIQQLMHEKETDQLERLTNQLELLDKEQKRLLTLMTTIKKTIQTKKGMLHMTTEEKFRGFTYEDGLAYQDEAIQTYGKEVIKESLNK